jgi:peptidyl-prolyl cis-trans isomerase D
MLSVMRDNVGGWVAKIFIGLLALSFAVWGIADIFTGYRGDALVVVGEEEISSTAYDYELQRRIQALSSQFGQPLTLDMARSLGIHRQVLAEMIRDAVIDSQVSTLNLAVSDSTIAERIANDPRFQDSQGRFNQQGFQRLLASNGLTEQSYAMLEREAILRREVAGAIGGGLTAPNTLVEALVRQQEELRIARYLTVPTGAVDAVAEPTETEQRAYYDDNKRSFTAPEYRTLVVLRLDPEDIADSLLVTDEEVRQIYDQRISDYTTPETREIQQISFNSIEEAQAARDRIAAGEDFLQIAVERGLQPIDYNLGQLEHREIADVAVADAAFALRLEEVSNPVEGKLSILLLRIASIQAETSRSFEEVRVEIESRLGLERAQEEILNLHDAVEDARAEGASLQEIGSKFDLPIIMVDSIDRSGNGPQGTPVDGIPATNSVLRSAFESDIGVENDPLDTANEGFAWVDVVEITPPAIRPFEDVQAEIIELWTANQSREALLDKTKELLEEARAGRSLDRIAEALEVAISETDPIKRNDTPEGLAAAAITNIFRTPLDGFALAQSADGGSFVIVQVTSVEAPQFAADSAESAAVRDEIVTTMGEDLLQQYIGGLQESIGIEINEELWNQLHGEAS